MSVGLIILSFGAGLLSFLSPCVLPLVPIYIGYLSGAAATPEGVVVERRETLAHALAFVLGFTTIFIAIFSALLSLTQYVDKQLLARVAGMILILFGIHLTGLVRIPFLYREARVQYQSDDLGLPRSFLTGMAFAAGWTPCVGPMLSFILALGTQTDTALQGTALLLLYSAGLGVPFLLTAYALETATRKLKGLNRYMHQIEILSGLLLVAVGLLMVSGQFQTLNVYFFQLAPEGFTQAENWLQQILGVSISQ